MAILDALALILAGGPGAGLSVLTTERSEAALPFGGKYRIIDFTLSNCVNSGLNNVAILTQYQPRSLNEHIGRGRPWDLDRTTGGIRLLQPYQSRRSEATAWQEGPADAVRFNLDFIREQSQDIVLILAGDHLYKMDYRPLLRYHLERNADLTLAIRAVNPYEAHRYGMVAVDPDGRVSQFEEKPRRTRSTLANMGVYAISRSLLTDWLGNGGARQTDFGREVIPSMIAAGKRVFGYSFLGYWLDVGTVQAYWEANMALLGETPALDLYDPEWVVHTRSEERPPVFFSEEAQANGSLLSDGCRIEGRVVRSLIWAGVYVAPGAVVRDSIIFTDSEIGPGAVVDRAIVDKSVRVGEGTVVGQGEDGTPNRALPNLLNTGITLVGKGAEIPAGVEVGRNVVIRPHTSAGKFDGQRLASGSTL